MMSPQPEARSRNGDSAMTPVSMMTAIGVCAARLTFSPFFWIEGRDDTTPSWLAAVGTLTKGMPALKEAHFATSIDRPPATRSASKGVSILNSDDPSCQMSSDGSHRRASPRNLYGCSVPDARLDGVPPRRRPGNGPCDGGSGAGGGRVPPRERPLRRPRVRGGRRLLRARGGVRL